MDNVPGPLFGTVCKVSEATYQLYTVARNWETILLENGLQHLDGSPWGMTLVVL
jgi:hypothetical protein